MRAIATLLTLWVMAAGGVACAPAAPSADSAGTTLHVASAKDGDSFLASDGVEYRVGMINTPEADDCGGQQASDRTRALLADGFSAQAYATDQYGRSVARITTSAGDLGVNLAREGLADDRYLQQFRHQQPDYATELGHAFAEARLNRTGLWSTCWAAGPD